MKPAEVDRAVEFINRTADRLRGPALAREIGSYVLEAFFGGDFEEFSRPSRSKPVSFRSLARRTDLRLKSHTVYCLVRISRQLGELPSEVGERLSLSHHRALLPLSDLSTKVRLAETALNCAWSKNRLEEEVRALSVRPRRGRPASPELARLANRFARETWSALRRESAERSVASLGAGDLLALVGAIQECRCALAALEQLANRALESRDAREKQP